MQHGGFRAPFMEDIFESFFGNSGFNPFGRKPKGENYNISITIPFVDACLGTTKAIQFSAPELCPDCNGAGGSADSKVICSDCKGAGVISRGNKANINIIFNTTCPRCSGIGHTYTAKCQKCSGAKHTTVEKKYDVKIPAGIQNGTTLRLSGLGAGGAGGQRGDLFVAVSVEHHPTMRVNGHDILSDANISLKSSLLGCDIDVDTLHGPVKLKIPPCTHHGQKLSLKDKGIKARSATGSHIVIVNVEFPKSLTQEQQDGISKIL